MRRNGIFVITLLITLLFWQWAYFQLKNHYSGLQEAHLGLANMEKTIQKANLRAEVIQYKFDLFKQEVARLLPQEKIDGTSSKYKYPFINQQRRGLASVVQLPPKDFLNLAQFETSVEQLESLFENHNYTEVIQKAKNLLALDPVSPSLVSIYFMLAESYYQTNEMESCLEIGQQMTQLFPDQPKTGFVLLRVGLFLQEKNRTEEARNIYSLVSHVFEKENSLKKQADKLLSNLGSTE